MAASPQRRPLAAQPAVLLVAGLTLLGLAIRVAEFDQSLLGDELSTYWILHGHSLGDVLSSVRSNDEITPPLYFILGWLSLKVGPDPEWVRLPSLVAGTATIPLVYLLGARTVGRGAGLVGAAVMALSPFMIYYSVEARSYALMIALLTASTVALLAAVDSGRARWWIAYAACSCGALLSHYTSVFPLAAQFGWMLWAHREAIRALLLANLGVLVGFAPWIPGFIADNNSPTTKILSALQPFTVGAVRFALENWAVGYPYVRLDTAPGHVAGVLIAVGLLIAIVAATLGAWHRLRRSRMRLGTAVRRIPPRIVLVATLAIATPLGEAIYSAFGTNLLGARNLNASWPGLAVAIGAIVTAAGMPLALASGGLVIAGYGIAAARTLDPDLARIDYADAARTIEARWRPGDVVVDAAPLTPVPLTGLDVYLPQTHREFRLGLPVSNHPFMIGDPVPPANRLIAEALEAAEGRSVLLVTHSDLSAPAGQASGLLRGKRTLGEELLRRVPPGSKVTDLVTTGGFAPLDVIQIQVPPS
jgi:4-amino-4-deoxy-L-arabinose transferase-like glycosyltransferase